MVPSEDAMIRSDNGPNLRFSSYESASQRCRTGQEPVPQT